MGGAVSDLSDIIEGLRAGRPRQPSPELDALAQEVVESQAQIKRELDAMTPEQRDAWIKDWASRMAAVEVEEGTKLDQWLNSGGMAQER